MQTSCSPAPISSVHVQKGYTGCREFSIIATHHHTITSRRGYVYYPGPYVGGVWGGGGGGSRTPLLSCTIHNSAYVSHTLLIKNRTPPPPPLVKKNLGAAYRPSCYHTFLFVLYRSWSCWRRWVSRSTYPPSDRSRLMVSSSPDVMMPFSMRS